MLCYLTLCHVMLIIGSWSFDRPVSIILQDIVVCVFLGVSFYVLLWDKCRRLQTIFSDAQDVAKETLITSTRVKE